MALLDRIERRLPLLALGPRDAPARQRTLHDTIAWSYDLLCELERRLIRRLSAFVDGWTLEGAEAIFNAGAASESARTREHGPSSPLDAPPTPFDLLASLVDKSLVLRVESATSEPRFGMLQTIREHGAERLKRHGEEALTRQAHAGHCLRLVESVTPLLHGPEQTVWLDRLDEEHAQICVQRSPGVWTPEMPRQAFVSLRPCTGSGSCAVIWGRGEPGSNVPSGRPAGTMGPGREGVSASCPPRAGALRRRATGPLPGRFRRCARPIDAECLTLSTPWGSWRPPPCAHVSRRGGVPSWRPVDAGCGGG